MADEVARLEVEGELAIVSIPRLTTPRFSSKAWVADEGEAPAP
jgi:hypothetical protein